MAQTIPDVGRTGWPWINTNDMVPLSHDNIYPKVSIVTPSYNQGHFLEETILSVIHQGYPNLEYIIIDGGSTDNSVDIIKKYENHISYWTSNKDNGQSDAIYRGFSIATGEILAWLNSDDILLPNALNHISYEFCNNKSVGVVYGDRLIINELSEIIDIQYAPAYLTPLHWAKGQYVGQESCFWRKSVYDKVGGLDPELFFVMDYDLLVRMSKITKFKKISKYIGGYREHADTKSSNYESIRRTEMELVKKRYGIQDLGFIILRLVNYFVRFQIALEKLMLSRCDK